MINTVEKPASAPTASTASLCPLCLLRSLLTALCWLGGLHLWTVSSLPSGKFVMRPFPFLPWEPSFFSQRFFFFLVLKNADARPETDGTQRQNHISARLADGRFPIYLSPKRSDARGRVDRSKSHLALRSVCGIADRQSRKLIHDIGACTRWATPASSWRPPWCPPPRCPGSSAHPECGRPRQSFWPFWPQPAEAPARQFPDPPHR